MRSILATTVLVVLAGCATNPKEVVEEQRENLLNYATGQREYAKAILEASQARADDPNYILVPIFSTEHKIGDILPADNVLDRETKECRYPEGQITKDDWAAVPITDDTKSITLSVNAPDLLTEVKAGDKEIGTGFFSEGKAKFGLKDVSQTLLDREQSRKLLEECEAFVRIAQRPDYDPKNFLLVRGVVRARETFESGGDTTISAGVSNLPKKTQFGARYVNKNNYSFVEDQDVRPKYMILMYPSHVYTDKSTTDEYEGLLEKFVPNDITLR